MGVITTDESANEESNPQSNPQEAQQDENKEPTNQGESELSAEDYKAEAEKWKALSRKNEAQAKANAEAAKQWAELQESKKTDDQKREEAEKERLAEIEQLRFEKARLEAITKYGLSAEDLQILEGLPAEAFDERAKALAERLKPARKSPSAGIGQEVPPKANASSDWLRNAINNS